jgi:hypothetical protein
MGSAKDVDGGMEAAMCSLAATSSTLAVVDDEIGAGLPACNQEPMDGVEDGDGGVEAVGV